MSFGLTQNETNNLLKKKKEFHTCFETVESLVFCIFSEHLEILKLLNISCQENAGLHTILCIYSIRIAESCICDFFEKLYYYYNTGENSGREGLGEGGRGNPRA